MKTMVLWVAITGTAAVLWATDPLALPPRQGFQVAGLVVGAWVGLVYSITWWDYYKAGK